MSKAVDFPSTAETTLIPPIGPISYGWIASDLSDDGTVGEAHLGTAEKGKVACEHQIAGFIDLLRKVKETPIGNLSPTKDGPS